MSILVLLVLAALAASAVASLIAWTKLGSTTDAREPVFIPSQRPGGDR
ncbi:hypothetical protein [Streptomyces sp. MUM 16J]|nr:hypothetical protein [Streptomyces sp. MUM 16J]MCH0555786.1 hypothetical protein [Streptomyces sp. MUM 16J]